MLRQHILLFGLLVSAGIFSLGYAIREKREASAMADSREQMRASLAEAREEIQTLSSKVNSLTEAAALASAPLAVVPPPAESVPARRPSPFVRPPRPATRSVARSKPLEDQRWKRVESQLAEHRSQLAEQRERISETREAVRTTGNQLDGKINSTREDLNRSIATTHDEVVVLQRRGERNIYEFDLTKSKQFQRVGPLSLSLRKADTKHGVYDMAVVVDDRSLTKEHVNLFEPVWIDVSGRSQPIQVVVNKIDKNRVRGYISEPRYKTADLAGAAAASASQAPALKPR
jgi:hypothetical protein